jgi:hypothetical protein
VTTRAVREQIQGLGGQLAVLLRGKWVSVLTTVLLAGVVAVAVPALLDAGRGVWYRAFGCPHPVQLRMVADPETFVTARELAAAYERAAAEDGHGCPSARVFVFEASTADMAGALASGDGWGASALQELGPQPDVWLAATAHAVDTLPPGPGPGLVADHVTVARSPLVLAVPGDAPQPDAGWSALVRERADRGERVVQPDPASSQLGLLGTALLYGPPAGRARRARRSEPGRLEPHDPAAGRERPRHVPYR